ncbi:MAG: thioesterase family protein [Ilumatobacteraceae bacterium]
MSVVVGLRGVAELIVTTADTAVALGSGDVAVLATPRVVALCEEASCRALDGHLDATTTTVGTRIELDHVRPTAVGARVGAEARLEEIDGRRLTFIVSAADSAGVVATGRVIRVVVDRIAFIERLR